MYFNVNSLMLSDPNGFTVLNIPVWNTCEFIDKSDSFHPRSKIKNPKKFSTSPQTSTRSTFNYDTRHHVFKVTKLVWSWNTLRPHSTQNVYILSLDTIYRSFKYIRWNKLAKSWSMRTSQQPTEQQHFRKNGHSAQWPNSEYGR